MLLPRFRRLSLLLATSALLIPAYYAHAGSTSITDSQTTPVTTNGNDVTIESGGSVTITKGAAVTVNSANVVDNEGTITGNDGNNVTGILVISGGKQTITNGGVINITDSTLATSLPLTKGENRYAIQIDTRTPFVGSITNATTGVITVRGNDSAGIYINNSQVQGSITNAGTIGITGNNSYGILVSPGSSVTGSIIVQNSIDALGQGSSGILLNGAVGGELSITDTIRSDGYYNGDVVTARPGTFSGTLANLAQSASSVAINSDIVGGISIADTGTVVTYGSAPALAIMPGPGGSANIGSTGSTKNSKDPDLVISGIVRSNGIYDHISSTAIQIGGGGGTATLTQGMKINSGAKVDATAFASNAAAIVIGSGANVAALNNAGTIAATVNFGEGDRAAEGGQATGIQVKSGGALNVINNRGQITATTVKGEAVALDMRGDTKRITVRQLASTTGTAPSITGNILFGSKGADLELDAGTIDGNVRFGASATNALTINNGGILGGAITQAAGGQLNLKVQNGLLASSSTAKLKLSKLTLGSKGQIDFAVDPTTGKNGSVSVSGAVSITSGAKIGLALDSQLTSPQTFTVIETVSANALAGQPTLLLGDVPYFYNAKIITDVGGGTIGIGLSDRSFAQAGVLGSESAYNAVFKDNYSDIGIRNVFNAAGSKEQFQRVFSQMLPSYSGGLFEILSQGADTLARTEADSSVMLRGNRTGAWAQQFGFGAVDSTSSSPGYHGGGLGFAFGWEEPITTTAAWGLTAAYMRAAVDDFNTGPNNEEIGTTYTIGAYYRESDGRLHYDASLNGGVALMNSTRNFLGTDLTGTEISRFANADWTGGVMQAHLGISYEEQLDEEWFVRPSIAGDYFLLSQGGRTEHNGGKAFDLAVDGATDSQGSVTGGVTVGMHFGDRDFMWRPEVMVGYKQVFGGPDTVNAAFVGGSSFSLSPASQKGGAIARIGIHGGNKFSDIAIEAGGEDRDNYRAFNGRIVARFQF